MCVGEFIAELELVGGEGALYISVVDGIQLGFIMEKVIASVKNTCFPLSSGRL